MFKIILVEITLIIRLWNIVTEINMEKKSPSIFLVTVIVIATALVIPMPGITAENNNNNIQPSQWCCSYIEEEDNDSQDLLILNNLPKHNSVI